MWLCSMQQYCSNFSAESRQWNNSLIVLKKQIEEYKKQVAALNKELTGDGGLTYKELYEQEKLKRIELEHKLKDRFDPFTGLPIAG